MDVARYKKELFISDRFVIEELQKVQTLYELKRVIRYNHSRITEADSESTAEHIFGMHCLVDYFLPLEDQKGIWDQTRIRAMVQYHDIDEIVTGDIVSYLKSANDIANERSAAEQVIAKLPETMQRKIQITLNEYKAKTTPEAKFVKAIDKIEPVFHVYNKAGRQTLTTLKTTKEQHDRIKFPYVQEFPVINRFAEVMSAQFEKEGFFHKQAC